MKFIDAIVFLVLLIQYTNGSEESSPAIVNQIVGEPLGMESGAISDSSLTASNSWSYNHGPHRARLNIMAEGKLRAGWSASPRRNPWIQVDLTTPHRVTGIATQGRDNIEYWLTGFKVTCSLDGNNYDTIQDKLVDGTDKTFPGNFDRQTIVFHAFPVAKVCRYVRVYPTSWNDRISLRMEIYGESAQLDGEALGMESGDIPDSSVTASDSWDFLHGPHRGRLNLIREIAPGKRGKLRGGWSASPVDDLWIQVDLIAPYWIGRVVTQGRFGADQWLTSYKIACSMDGEAFDMVKDIPNNPDTEKVFPGNSDRHTPVFNTLPITMVCRYVRLYPITWNDKVGMRMELYGEGPITDSSDIEDPSPPKRPILSTARRVAQSLRKQIGGRMA